MRGGAAAGGAAPVHVERQGIARAEAQADLHQRGAQALGAARGRTERAPAGPAPPRARAARAPVPVGDADGTGAGHHPARERDAERHHGGARPAARGRWGWSVARTTPVAGKVTNRSPVIGSGVASPAGRASDTIEASAPGGEASGATAASTPGTTAASTPGGSGVAAGVDGAVEARAARVDAGVGAAAGERRGEHQPGQQQPSSAHRVHTIAGRGRRAPVGRSPHLRRAPSCPGALEAALVSVSCARPRAWSAVAVSET
jgi:hypothetical protein